MQDFLDRLAAEFGAARVRVGAAAGARHAHDWSGLPPCPPAAVLLPEDTATLALMLRRCHAAGRAVTVQGGLTGLAGGAHPGPGELALSLERMSGIEELDPAGATMTVLAGTPLQMAQEAAAAAGFTLGIDLGARGSCQVGGNVATNAGGVNVIRYGMARASVRGLEVVLADGTVVGSLNTLAKNNAGYDWTQLFIGSEGTLGVVTRVVLALHPLLENRHTAFCGVADFGAALALLRRLERAVPGRILAFEAMWSGFHRFATATCGCPPPLAEEHPLYLLIETDLDDESALETLMGGLLEAGMIRDAVLARSEAERRRLWAIREVPAEYDTHFRTGMAAFDVSIPLARMAAAVEALEALLASRWPEAVPLFYGHVADANLHLVIGRLDGGALDRRAIDATIYDAVGAIAGASVSAEHGIGTVKRAYLPLTRSAAELELMRLLKRSLDPKSILNPGKVV